MTTHVSPGHRPRAMRAHFRLRVSPVSDTCQTDPNRLTSPNQDEVQHSPTNSHVASAASMGRAPARFGTQAPAGIQDNRSPRIARSLRETAAGARHAATPPRPSVVTNGSYRPRDRGQLRRRLRPQGLSTGPLLAARQPCASDRRSARPPCAGTGNEIHRGAAGAGGQPRRGAPRAGIGGAIPLAIAADATRGASRAAVRPLERATACRQGAHRAQANRASGSRLLGSVVRRLEAPRTECGG